MQVWLRQMKNLSNDLCKRSSFVVYGKRIATAQKMRFSIKDFFSKCDKIRCILQIWSHSLKKSVMENFIFCAVCIFCLHSALISFLVKYPIKILKGCQTVVSANQNYSRTPEKHYLISRSICLMFSRLCWKMCYLLVEW